MHINRRYAVPFVVKRNGKKREDTVRSPGRIKSAAADAVLGGGSLWATSCCYRAHLKCGNSPLITPQWAGPFPGKSRVIVKVILRAPVQFSVR